MRSFRHFGILARIHAPRLRHLPLTSFFGRFLERKSGMKNHETIMGPYADFPRDVLVVGLYKLL